MLDRQPTLQGPTLLLRPLCADDFESLYTVAADPFLWAQHPAANRYQRPVFERFFAEGLASGGALLVQEAKGGAVIGSSRYEGYDAVADEVEIGWTFLARRCWGGAVNGELKRLMLDHAFASVSTVVFNIGASNWRSQAAVRKLGGQQVSAFNKPDGAAYLRFTLQRSAEAPTSI